MAQDPNMAAPVSNLISRLQSIVGGGWAAAGAFAVKDSASAGLAMCGALVGTNGASDEAAPGVDGAAAGVSTRLGCSVLCA